jgi:hypothetical protein
LEHWCEVQQSLSEGQWGMSHFHEHYKMAHPSFFNVQNHLQQAWARAKLES